MTGLVRRTTSNYGFKIINYDFPRWHTAEWENWDALDAILKSANIISVTGVWANSTAYTAGQRLVDDLQGTIWLCQISHTSPATGTFEEARIANPTYWTAVTAVPLFRGAWAPSTLYATADIVTVDTYKYYYCINTHTSSAVFADDVDNWTLMFDATAAATSGVVRFDSPQILTTAEQAQARVNILAARFDAAQNILNVNPWMEHDQENNSVAVTATSSYPTDQHLIGLAGSMAVSANRQLLPFQGAPQLMYRPMTSAQRVTVTTADASLAAGEFLLPLSERIEGLRIGQLGFGTAGAKGIDILTICRLTAGPANAVVSLFVRNGAANRSYVHNINHLLTTPLAYLTRVPGDTLGTWAKDASHGMDVGLCIGTGSTFQVPSLDTWTAGNYVGNAATTNLAATINNIFDVAAVLVMPAGMLGLAPGPINDNLVPDLLNIRRPYDNELRLCKRYFERMPFITTDDGLTIPFTIWEVYKRATPILGWVHQSGTGATWANLAHDTAKGLYQVNIHSDKQTSWVTGNARL